MQVDEPEDTVTSSSPIEDGTMFRTVRDRVGSNRLPAPSPATGVSMIALFVALGGSAYAAFDLPSNSVGTKQLKNGAVTTKKLANNALTSEKVKDYSLLAKDFKRGQLPTGPPGPKGDPGVSGATNIVMRTGPNFTLGPDGSGGGSAQCHAGEKEKATGGGVYPVTSDAYPQSGTGLATIRDSYPLPAGANDGATPTGWYVSVAFPSGTSPSPSPTLTPYVICASP
jgi:hypothetical protein